MAIISAVQPKFISLKNDGSPNSLGTVGFYTAGTSFAAGNEITIWDTFTKDSTLTNPVTLDSDGTKEVWFDVTCDIEELDSDGNALANGQTLAVDPNISTTSTGNYNQAPNGSFEVGTTVPDNWTLSAETGGTIAIDATSGGQSHGDQGLKFTGSTNGGGTATSDFFSVTPSAAVKTIFTYKSTISTVTNTVAINWYQYDDTASSTATTTVYTATSGHPSSFTTYIRGDAVPSDAVKAKVVLTGVGSSGTTKVGPTWFDDVQVINIPVDDIIYDSNGNEVLTTVGTASAVNNVRITNVTTGNAAKIDVTETNTNLQLAGNGTGIVEVASLQASTGVLFGSDTAAANTLDDYEEGTWTPTINATGGEPTYTLQEGYYTKIGNTVFFEGKVVVNSIVGLTSGINMGGLPFTCQNTTGDTASCVVGAGASLVITAGWAMSGTIRNNSAIVDMNLWKTTGGTQAVDISELSTAGAFTFSGNYKV